MSRRSHLKRGAATLATLVGGTLLAGCGSSTPHVAPFTLTAGSQPACTAIMDALPTTLNGQKRLTSTGSPYGAIWGSPPIQVRCGVSEPAGFNAEAQCLTVNGIDWFLVGNPPAMGNKGSPNDKLVVTTVYRTPAVEVTVPTSYGGQAPSAAMAELTSDIEAHTKVSDHCQ